MSKKFAVLGQPIEHSKSPTIHLAAYRVLGEDWAYGRAEVNKGFLRTFIGGLEDPWDGFSVPMPLKEEATRFADDLDEFAKQTGATNTLVRDEKGTWHGYNTDVFGIYQAVRERTSTSINTSLVIGSGATATSAIAAIAKLAPGSKVKVHARNPKTRKELLNFAKSLGLKTSRIWGLVNTIASADLVVSTVPAHAMDAQAEELENLGLWKPNGLLLDVAYSPWPSKIASLWINRGGQVASGFEMLIWQAVAQIRIFRSGNPSQELPNEIAVVEAMRRSVSV